MKLDELKILEYVQSFVEGTQAVVLEEADKIARRYR